MPTPTKKIQVFFPLHFPLHCHPHTAPNSNNSLEVHPHTQTRFCPSLAHWLYCAYCQHQKKRKGKSQHQDYRRKNSRHFKSNAWQPEKKIIKKPLPPFFYNFFSFFSPVISAQSNITALIL